jgi:hypothetical protein
MELYKGFYIYPHAGMVHPFSPASFPAGVIYKQGRLSSVVEVARFELRSFTVDMQELAEWFGLELCKLIVDECLTHRSTVA